MLPDPQNPPTATAQLAVHKPITSLVARELRSPERAVRSRHAGVTRATVPEAAVHKHGQTLPAKDKIRPSENREVPAPTNDAGEFEEGGECRFGQAVAVSADMRHDLRTLCFAENVGHSNWVVQVSSPFRHQRPLSSSGSIQHRASTAPGGYHWGHDRQRSPRTPSASPQRFEAVCPSRARGFRPA